MTPLPRFRSAAACLLAAVALVAASAPASASVSLTQVSTDPYTNTTSQHHTEVEPDTFSFGSTVVSAFQVGRFTDGGSSNIGWATSTNGGGTWTSGDLTGVTGYAGGSYDRATDPSVAYDARHTTWMIESLALSGSSVRGAAVLVSRSTNGGLTWGSPATVTAPATQNLDKTWIACDNNSSTSSFYGHCYAEWDDNGAGDVIYMSTSADGGSTWSTPVKTANSATGLGGQPVVQPNGTVIVPINNAFESAVLAFRSTNGGATWSSPVTVSSIKDHTVRGSLRAGPLVSAESDAAGKVYVVWQDCRFRKRCNANDIVMSTSSDGSTWSAVVRIPIDGVNSSVDHFIPGLGVDAATSGASAHLGLTYYYYPSASCSVSRCQLDTGFVSSVDGGTSWNSPTQLAGPMTITSLPSTTEGYMVGDYISTSFSGGAATTVIAVASAPSGGAFNETMNAPSSALAPAAGNFVVTSGGQQPVPNAASDHAAAPAPITHH